MTLQLVKKDFLLVKKYLPFMILVAFGLPIFVQWRVPAFTRFIPFLFTVFFTEFMLCQYVGLIESRYPKADALLAAVSYSRSAFVRAKYLFFLLVFLFCMLAYGVVVLLVPPIEMPTVTEMLLALAIGAVPYSLYLPFQFKFGFEKTKFAFMILIFGFSFGIPVLYGVNLNFIPSGWETVPVFMQNLILTAVIAVAFGVSMMISTKIYGKKDL